MTSVFSNRISRGVYSGDTCLHAEKNTELVTLSLIFFLVLIDIAILYGTRVVESRVVIVSALLCMQMEEFSEERMIRILMCAATFLECISSELSRVLAKYIFRNSLNVNPGNDFKPLVTGLV